MIGAICCGQVGWSLESERAEIGMKEEGVRVEEEKEELGWNDEICKSGRNISTSGYTNGRWPLFLKARKLR